MVATGQVLPTTVQMILAACALPKLFLNLILAFGADRADL